MVKLLIGFLGGAIGGAAVDLIFLTFAGPSALLTLILGIEDRLSILAAHVVLGGILGMLFVLILRALKKRPSWKHGILWGLVCLAIIGGIPSLFVQDVTAIATIFGFIVWIIYGLILVGTIRFFH